MLSEIEKLREEIKYYKRERDDWKWILIRNDSGNWEHVDHGY